MLAHGMLRDECRRILRGPSCPPWHDVKVDGESSVNGWAPGGTDLGGSSQRKWLQMATVRERLTARVGVWWEWLLLLEGNECGRRLATE